jgi:hypothetical protein
VTKNAETFVLSTDAKDRATATATAAPPPPPSAPSGLGTITKPVKRRHKTYDDSDNDLPPMSAKKK